MLLSVEFLLFLCMFEIFSVWSGVFEVFILWFFLVIKFVILRFFLKLILFDNLLMLLLFLLLLLTLMWLLFLNLLQVILILLIWLFTIFYSMLFLVFSHFSLFKFSFSLKLFLLNDINQLSTFLQLLIINCKSAEFFNKQLFSIIIFYFLFQLCYFERIFGYFGLFKDLIDVLDFENFDNNIKCDKFKLVFLLLLEGLIFFIKFFQLFIKCGNSLFFLLALR